MPSSRRRLLFELFVLSGFCGLLYQVVWMRLGFASFGITTPVVSVVISVFMLGLALGSWASGRIVGFLTRTTKLSAIYFYAIAELLIGTGAFLVPYLLQTGESLLAQMGEADSIAYLSFSAAAIALSLFPWCIGMGATFPLVMAYVREHRGSDQKSFSHLYLANVLGASLGALLTASVLVELLGFRHTLWIGGALNVLVAAAGLVLGLQSRRGHSPGPAASGEPAPADPTGIAPWVRTMLFTTGLASLAMEVVWTRSFGPLLGTQVYAFAALLVVYLVGTWTGSYWYRRSLARSRTMSSGQLLAIVAIASLLPVVVNDPRLIEEHGARVALALASIFPLCTALGYLTPRLIDDCSRGHPRIAGRAYALNVLGCIVGPLLASYVFLPLLGASLSLVVLTLPLLGFAFKFRRDIPAPRRWGLAAAAAALLSCALFVNVSYENPCAWGARNCEIRRDYAATVVAFGAGMKKFLLVNGIGMTGLTPITKYMAHLPLAFHQGRAESALVICFGMGTTYRSLLSHDLRTTAVELVPSVRDAFPFFFADASTIMRHPKGRVVIDDGRRFLKRTRERYDIIVVDPPPPIEAAGSSLLYSREFHEAVRLHLKPGGVFQTWFPSGEVIIARAIAKSLTEVFPHLRVYVSVEGRGLHFLASMEPLEDMTVDKMLLRLPMRAQRDLSEWSRDGLRADIGKVLAQELPIARVLPDRPSILITDDRPYNEYFLLRRTFERP